MFLSNNIEEDSEEDFEEECDSCNRPGQLTECPSSWEEVHEGVTYYKRFCEACCASIFETEGCQDNVEQCSRADELFSKQLETLALQKGLEKSSKQDQLYFDKSKVYSICTCHLSPETLFNDKEYATEECQFFAGTDHILAKTANGLSAYRNDVVDRVEGMLEELHLFGSGYLLLTNSRILVVQRYPAWAAIAPLERDSGAMEMLLSEEKEKFIDKTVKGAAFFEIQSQKDDLIITRPSKLVIDWKRIDDGKFQELCRDLLVTLPGVKEARITGGQGEWGQDIEMIENVGTLIGEVERRWVIQCKHFGSRSVRKSDLKISSLEAILKFNCDVYCVMTSGLVSPGCYEFLDMMQKDKRLRIECKVFDRKKLEDLVKARPDVYAKYFG
jgi:hypothetical protein